MTSGDAVQRWTFTLRAPLGDTHCSLAVDNVRMGQFSELFPSSAAGLVRRPLFEQERNSSPADGAQPSA